MFGEGKKFLEKDPRDPKKDLGGRGGERIGLLATFFLALKHVPYKISRLEWGRGMPRTGPSLVFILKISSGMSSRRRSSLVCYSVLSKKHFHYANFIAYCYFISLLQYL